jgi:deoxyribodipyrimidine photo-lyase
MLEKRVLIWYRNDLRVHDHEPLQKALDTKGQVIPFYCFDDRQFTTTSFGFPKTGKYRAQFLLESVADLKKSLQNLGSDLIIRSGKPEIIISDLVKQLEIDEVYYHKEVTSEELLVENKLKASLSKLKVKIESFWGSTLYLSEDLSFAISAIPELYTNFRKAVENEPIIRPVLPAPQKLLPLPDIDVGKIPCLTDLGVENPVFDQRSVLQFKGGETEAIARLNYYFWQASCLREYKQTRNKMLGADYSSKFSPWLALGCISPRYIYEQVKKYETEIIKNDSTYWLIFELIWRDFFRFICAKHGNKIFHLSGLRGININWKEDWQRFDLWREGKTGYPLVDANMRELAATGFMSNRGRQNVASFLTKNLGIDWRIGAEWFESLLIDYDVCSNWGNWNYTAGVGNDARGFRYFNISKQSKDYDPQGNYIRHWLPELNSIPGSKVHETWQLTADEQKRYGVKLGVDYPRPVVDFFQSVKANEKIYNHAVS